jgi:hypothetical protein
MQLGRLLVIDTDPATQFTDAIAQNASEMENWTPDMALAAAPDCRGRIVAIAIISDQNLAWEITTWSREAGAAAASVALDSFLGRKAFVVGDGLQIAGAGSWRYFASGLDLPVLDEDPQADRDTPYAGRLHISLVNRSAGSKNAGATGEIKIRLFIDPTLGGQ